MPEPRLRSDLLRIASGLPVGDPTRRELLAALGTASREGATFERPEKLNFGSVVRSLSKATSEYGGGDDQEALHHIGEAVAEIAWVIREIGDPQAEKVMDAARDFAKMHQ